MKLRDRLYPNGYGSLERTAKTAAAAATRVRSAASPLSPVAAVGPVDVASLIGIPKADLPPKVCRAIDRMTSEVQRLTENLEQANKRVGYLETLADQDALTSLLNRRAFVRELSRMMAFAERYKTPSSVVYFDVNGMKQINDTLGHAAGDAALSHIGRVLLDNIRASDFVGRLGGDEFAVVLAQVDREAALVKAQDLARSIESRPVLFNGTSLQLRVAYGVHSFAGEEPVDEALHAADRAMYAHKNAPPRSTGN